MVASQPTILVVDDEPHILRLLGYVLVHHGYTVELAGDGAQGLALARSWRPRLILLDVMMPRMNGYEVCEQIKQDPELAGTYVVMLSAKGQQVDRERGMLGGADEYITKPFSPREVVALVRRVLEPAPVA